MLPHEGLCARIDHHRLSEMISKSNALRTALRRRKPRCRICRDETLRMRVDTLLEWRGIPILLGPGRVPVVTYADILRNLEPLNGSRAPMDHITYNSLWVHAKRHYDLTGILDHWTERLDKELRCPRDTDAGIRSTAKAGMN
jgi:hypothetical protein